MAVAVVDLLEIVHVEHHQHPALVHLGRAVQVAVLVQQPCQGIQLVPHLVAVDEIQHRQQRDAQPCDVQIRQRHLHHRLRRQKEDKRIDKHPAPVLKLHGGDNGRPGQAQDGGEVGKHITIKIRAPGIDILPAYPEHQPKGKGQGQKHQIAHLAPGGHPQGPLGGGFLIQHIHQADRHPGGQPEAQIIGQHIGPPVPGRCAVHRHGDDFQQGNPPNQPKGQQKAPLLFPAQGLAQRRKDAHKPQHKQVDGR